MSKEEAKAKGAERGEKEHDMDVSPKEKEWPGRA
jgi:hypothetical protein